MILIKRSFMKDSEFSQKFGKVVSIILIVISSLIIIGLLGLLVYLDFHTSKPAFSLVWIVLLPIFGLIANRLIEHFIGDNGYGANWVSEARQGKGFVKQNKRRTRKVLTSFFECLLFVLLIIRFVALMSLNKVFSIK